MMDFGWIKTFSTVKSNIINNMIYIFWGMVGWSPAIVSQLCWCVKRGVLYYTAFDGSAIGQDGPVAGANVFRWRLQGPVEPRSLGRGERRERIDERSKKRTARGRRGSRLTTWYRWHIDNLIGDLPNKYLVGGLKH